MGSDFDEDDDLGGLPEAVGASFEDFDEDNPELDFYDTGSEPDEVETWRERANDAVEEVRAPRSQQGCPILRSCAAGHGLGLRVLCTASIPGRPVRSQCTDKCILEIPSSSASSEQAMNEYAKYCTTNM